MDILNRHKAALIIRAMLGVKRQKQTDLARKLNLNRVVLNMYLNRKIDLLPEDIEAIFKELGLSDEMVAKLSAPADVPFQSGE